MNAQYPSIQLQISPVVKLLIAINLIFWLCCQVILEGYFHIPFSKYLALFPGKFLYEWYLWQPFTYQFLHSMSVSHILFNMLMLWFVGVPLERKWGARSFFFYYIISGAGAALLYSLAVKIYSGLMGGGVQGLVIPVVGASGSIFALFLAYGLIFGEQIVYFMMILPVKAKYFVSILGGIEIVSLLTNGLVGGEVASFAHLGGLFSGYIYIVVWKKYLFYRWNSQVNKKKSKGLRLVVDNTDGESPSDKDSKGTRYWN